MGVCVWGGIILQLLLLQLRTSQKLVIEIKHFERLAWNGRTYHYLYTTLANFLSKSRTRYVRSVTQGAAA